jgi:hypothetical protein
MFDDTEDIVLKSSISDNNNSNSSDECDSMLQVLGDSVTSNNFTQHCHFVQ